MEKYDFIKWEKASKDTIDVKKVYIDIAGDVVGGIILSQIIYWHLPSNNGDPSRLKVYKKGDENRQPGYWLAKSYKDWYAECRVKEDTAMRRIQKLAKKGIIETHTWRFYNTPTTHIRIVWDKFLEELDNVLNKQDEEIEADNNTDDRSLHSVKQANSNNPRTQFADMETGKQHETLTETTTENTAMNTSKTKEYSTLSEKTATDKPYVDIPAGSSLNGSNSIENPGDDIPAVSVSSRDSASVKKDGVTPSQSVMLGQFGLKEFENAKQNKEFDLLESKYNSILTNLFLVIVDKALKEFKPKTVNELLRWFNTNEEYIEAFIAEETEHRKENKKKMAKYDAIHKAEIAEHNKKRNERLLRSMTSKRRVNPNNPS